MKEFIDKLISRLEEYKRKHRGSDFHYTIASNDIINIVNELAEEYINTSTEHINTSIKNIGCTIDTSAWKHNIVGRFNRVE